MRATECRPNACESDMRKKFNTTGACGTRVQQHSPVVARPYRLEFRAPSGLARNAFCVMATRGANERVFSMDGHVMKSRSANLKSSSERPIFQLCS